MVETPIDEMEPGSALDELVARRLMGWMPRPCTGEIVRMPGGGWHCRKCGKMGGEGEPTGHAEQPPRASTNIATAWRVLDRFAREGARVEVSANPPEPGPEPWCAIITVGGEEHRATGDTASLAICRAALKSVGVDAAGT